jgi:hypothetical protein
MQTDDMLIQVFPWTVLKFKEMSHRFHLLMEYSDYKNVVFTLPVKYGVSLVIMAPDVFGDLGARMSHKRRTGE